MDQNTTIPKKGTMEYLDYITNRHNKAIASGSKRPGLGLNKKILATEPVKVVKVVKPAPMSASEAALAKYEKENGSKSKVKY